MPSNEQIDHALQYVLHHSLVNTDKLSSDGKKLAHDTQDIIETLRAMVQQKNSDELFQQFIWHTREVDREGMKGAVKVNGGEGVEKDKMSEDQKRGQFISIFFSRLSILIIQQPSNTSALCSLSSSPTLKCASSFRTSPPSGATFSPS